MKDSLELLVEKYIHSDLSAAENAELNETLSASREARDIFRGRIAIHGGLNELFSGVIDIPFVDEPKSAKSRPWILPGIAALLLGLAIVWLRPVSPSEDSFAEVVGGLEPRWVTEVNGKVGGGRYELLSGLVEFQIGTGARIAIEGPAEFELIDSMHLKLRSGKLSATVLPESVGFEVETPDGRVVDLGTRFGVRVSKETGTEAHVFEGEIDVVNKSRSVRLRDSGAVLVSGLSPIGSDRMDFPMPGLSLHAQWAGDFDSASELGSGMPSVPGRWSGDLCEIVNRQQAGVRPVSGDGMLRFLKTNSPSIEGSDGTQASELWQLIDLQEFTDQVNGGEVSIEMQASFNRGAQSSNHESRLTVMAFRGQMSDAAAYWKRKNDLTSEQLGSASANVLTDSDPATWEPLEVKMAVPPGTDFVIAGITVSKKSEGPVDGHFADGIRMELSTRARKSRPQAVWIGEGGVDISSNWKDGKLPDRVHDAIDISGNGEAVVKGRFTTKQSLVVARGNETSGRLRIGKGGELIKSGFGEIIVGYNHGAVAEMVVEGTVKTRSHVFIGRNNKQSTLIIDGGTWDAGDGLIRMSQYDSPQDTVSELILRNGGTLRAGALAMVHDQSTLVMEDGWIEVGRLRVGGDNGTAQIRILGGEIRVGELSLGKQTGRIIFSSSQGRIRLHGEWTVDQLFALNEGGWWVDDSPGDSTNLEVEIRDGETLISARSR